MATVAILNWFPMVIFNILLTSHYDDLNNHTKFYANTSIHHWIIFTFWNSIVNGCFEDSQLLTADLHHRIKFHGDSTIYVWLTVTFWNSGGWLRSLGSLIGRINVSNFISIWYIVLKIWGFDFYRFDLKCLLTPQKFQVLGNMDP